ncbi:MAG: hypothetical protein J7M15_03750 [Anaerolineae bacterium]|nr:hypothetical protein [Anaerolineae bacterium]
MNLTERPSPELLAQHAAWWKREAHLVAYPYEPELGRLWLPLADGTTASDDLDLTPEMLDLDRLAKPKPETEVAPMSGGLLPVQVPYIRVPWMEAIAGCPIRALVNAGSMRTHTILTNWNDLDHLQDFRDDAWLNTLTALVERIVERSSSRQPVSHTLMRGPADIAEAMLGAERLCLAMYDRSEELAALLAYTTALFEEVWREQAYRIPSVHGGTVNWYGIWAPGSTVRTQCDASALTSPTQYAEHFVPWDLRTAKVADYSIMHLHSGSLHVIDALLERPSPTAIQVSLDPPPSAPPWPELLPTFAKILAHKPLLIDGYLSQDEVYALQRALPRDGLAIIARRA